MDKETPALISRLLLTAVLLGTALLLVSLLRSAQDTAADFNDPAESSAETSEPETEATTPPLVAEEDLFTDEWVVAASTTDLDPATAGSWAAMYGNDDGAVVSVVTGTGTFGFPELDKATIGTVDGWVLVDAEASNQIHISVPVGDEITHVRVAGLDREGAIAVAAALYSEGATSFVERTSDGQPLSDLLPASIADFVILGRSQPGTDPSAPSTDWTATNATTQTVRLTTFNSGEDSRVAQSNLLFNGATIRIDGRYILEPNQYQRATVGWSLSDGRFARISSPDLTVDQLLAIVNQQTG